MKRLIAFAFLALASCTPAMAADTPDKPNATAQVINHAIDKASDGLTQIAHALSTAAPQAWALAVHGTYAQGLAAVITGIILLLFGFASCGLSVWCGVTGRWNSYDPTAKQVFCIIFGIVAPIFFLIGLICALGDDSIVKVISPDGYLAQQILSKAL